MKLQSFFLLVIVALLLVACSPATQQPTLTVQPPAPTSTKAPAANPTPAAATATQAVVQPTQPVQLPTATAANTSGRPAVPAPYTSKTNPLTGNSAAIAAGKAEYAASCSSCHGDKADGNGRNSGSTPKPSNLLQTVKEASDAYILWRISEGGRMAPFNSRMSSFKNFLTETEIWQVVAYLQSLK